MYKNEKYKVAYSIYVTVSIIGVLIIAPFQFYLDDLLKIDELSATSYLVSLFLFICFVIPHYIRYNDISSVNKIKKNNKITLIQNLLLWIILIIASIILWVYHP